MNDLLRTIRARTMEAATRVAASDATPWGLAAVFAVIALLLAPGLQHNFDEGLYIQQALLILRGEWPYRDFFCHQTPLYPLVLAGIGRWVGISLLVFRASSVLATALSGVFVHRIATRLVSRPAAVCAIALFYVTPLQFYGLLAMPIALMQLCHVAGAYLVFFCRSRPALVGGAFLLVLSVLFKPLTVAALFAVGACLLVVPQQRWKVPLVVAGGVVSGLLALAAFQWVSDGAFVRTLQLQADRYAQRGGFETMMQFDPFWKVAAAGGVTNAVEWNLLQHRLALFLMAPINGNFWLLALATFGQVTLWRAPGRRWTGRRLFLTLWWAVPVVFSIWVWEPAWDHYCLQYVAPMAVLAAIGLNHVWTLPRGRRWPRRLARVGLVGAVLLGIVGIVGRRELEFAGLTTEHAGETWLTFDPLYNFVTETQPACGIVDPFNVYGSYCLVSKTTAPELRRFLVTAADVRRCFEADPSIKAVIGPWTAWFLDAELRSYLRTLPPERVVGHLPEH